MSENFLDRKEDCVWRKVRIRFEGVACRRCVAFFVFCFLLLLKICSNSSLEVESRVQSQHVYWCSEEQLKGFAHTLPVINKKLSMIGWLTWVDGAGHV